MRLLLDTHILIWALANTSKLSKEARDLIGDADNEVLFSAASIWEIAIKARLGRVSFVFEPDRILSAAGDGGWRELPVSAVAALRVRRLPHHHNDPFDRLLVAQAIEAGAELLTSDASLPIYGPLVRFV